MKKKRSAMNSKEVADLRWKQFLASEPKPWRPKKERLRKAGTAVREEGSRQRTKQSEGRVEGFLLGAGATALLWIFKSRLSS